MKKLLFSVLLGIAPSVNLFAQTTALDFTRDDCDGNNHNLFTELDNGNVVVLEYITNCSMCQNAAKSLKTIVNDFEQSNPGKVKIYSIAYANMTCSLMQSWAVSPGVTWPLITGGNSDVSYYGGGGMPTIVVAGGTDHKVYYKKIGFSTAEVPKIRTAIDDAISATAGVKKDANAKVFTVFPNPAKGILNVHFAAIQPDALVNIYDESGKEVMFLSAGASAATQIDVSSLASGIYHITLTSASKVLATERFTVQK